MQRHVSDPKASDPAWPPSTALAGMRVGLSGAMPDRRDLDDNHWSELDIRTAVQYVVEGVLLRGGRVVHGNHPTYRPLIEAVAGNEPDFWPGEKPVRMLVVSPYLRPGEADQLKIGHRNYAEIDFVGPSPDDKAFPRDQQLIEQERRNALAAMRRQMASEINALVCIGGRGVRPGVTPGVQVEASLAAEQNKPVYLAAALGGFARHVYEAKALPPENRSTNGLSPQENDRLSTDCDPADIAGLILKGLERYWAEHRDDGGDHGAASEPSVEPRTPATSREQARR